MTRFAFVLAMTAALLVPTGDAFSQTVKRKPATGVTFTLKSDVKVVKVRRSSATVSRIVGGGPGIKGEFACTCQGGEGTCKFVVQGNTLSCARGSNNTCSGDCTLTVGSSGAKAGFFGASKATAAR